MRVIGVDPGLTRCGIAVIDAGAGRSVTLLNVEVARTPTSVELGDRLVLLERAFIAAIAEFSPDAVAIERVFSQHNVRTVTGTAQASGIAALVAARSGVRVAFHTPSEVKASVTGSGVAGKAQVATMVSRIVGLTVDGPADATDAIALAICHAWRAPAQRAIDAAVARQRASLAASRSAVGS